MTTPTRRRKEERERRAGPPAHALPALVLVGALLFLSMAFLYPAAAFPVHGAGVALGLVAVAALALPGERGLFAGDMPPLHAALLGVAGLWAGLALMVGDAPVVAQAFAPAVTATLGFAVFAAALTAARGWERDRPEALSPLAVAALWLAVVLALQALYGIYQSLGPAGMPRTFATMEKQILQDVPPTDPLRSSLLHAAREARAAGTFGAANIFASFLAALLPILAALGIAAQGWRPRLLALAGGLAAAAALQLSGSRGGILAAVAALVFFGLLVATWKLSPRQRLLAWGGVGGGAVLLLAVLVFLVINQEGGGSRWIGASGLQQRFHYWQTALGMAAESPITGRGPGAYGPLYPQFRMPGANETKHAHSWLFQILAERGALGLAVWLAVLGIAGVIVQRLLARLATEDRSSEFLLASGLAAAAAGLLAHGLIEYTFAVREAVLLFFLLLGLLAGAAAPQPRADHRRPWAYLWVLLPLFGLLVVWRMQLQPLRGWLAREEASYLAQEGDMSSALQAYNDAVKSDPWTPENWELRGLTRAAMNRAGAEEDLRKALELAPQSARLHERLALFHAERGNTEEALRWQQQAVDLHPLDVSHWITLGNLYLDVDRRQDALTALQATEGLLFPRAEENAARDALRARLGLEPLE